MRYAIAETDYMTLAARYTRNIWHGGPMQVRMLSLQRYVQRIYDRKKLDTIAPHSTASAMCYHTSNNMQGVGQKPIKDVMLIGRRIDSKK